MRVRTGSLTTHSAPKRFEMRPCPRCENDPKMRKSCGICGGLGHALQPTGSLATVYARLVAWQVVP